MLIFVGPAVAFYVTKRICLGLQRKDKELLEHGLETGIIRQLPDGRVHRVAPPLDEEERAIIEAKKVPALMPAPGSEDENGVPAPQSSGVLGRGPDHRQPCLRRDDRGRTKWARERAR
jgi:ubiquinol-cytochrome c reductase cytochrome b subunit